MWLLNLDKKVNLTLNKENFVPWEIVKGTVSFDFWIEKVKLNNVSITLKKIIKKEVKTYSNWSYSYSTETQTYNIYSKKLKWEWEYNIENIDFEFQIPINIFPRTWNFAQKLDDFLNKLKIKGIFKDLIKLFISSLFINVNTEIPSFEIEARLDIPWGKDVVSVKQIDIYNSNKEIRDEKEVLTQIAKEEWIYDEENKQKLNKM